MGKTLQQIDWDSVRRDYAQRLRDLGVAITIKRAWGRLNDNQWIALPTANERASGRWWASLDTDRFTSDHALGVVVLCRTRIGEILEFGIPAERFVPLIPLLSRSKDRASMGHLDICVCTDGAYELRIPNRDPLPLEPMRGELGWLADRRHAQSDDHEPPVVPDETVTRFFAIVRDGALHPMDPAELDEGSAYLVEVRPAPAVPGVAAFRRILARSAPQDLPRDLAERHDRYAQTGAGR